MSTPCQNLECSAPEGRCPLGHLKFSACPHYPDGAEGQVNETVTGPASVGERLPWSGDALSETTLVLASGLQRPYLVALIGLPDAGKTSFLTTLYHRIRQEPLGDRTFAGSMTLRGWEVLNRHLRWQDGLPPSYPPRSSGVRRDPGFLHLALRSGDDPLTDLLIADTPGEWYRDFSDNDDVQGAKTTLRLADGLLFFLDPQTLEGSRRHSAKRALTGLIRRVKEHAPERPLGLVLTCADQPVERPGSEYAEVLGLFGELYPGHAVHRTISMFEANRVAEAGQGVLEAVAQLLAQLQARSTVVPPVLAREALLARFVQEEV